MPFLRITAPHGIGEKVVEMAIRNGFDKIKFQQRTYRTQDGTPVTLEIVDIQATPSKRAMMIKDLQMEKYYNPALISYRTSSQKFSYLRDETLES